MAKRFQRLPPHVRHARLRNDTVDTDRHQKRKCRPRNRKWKQEVEITLQRKTHGEAIPTATPTFSTMSYPNITLPTLSDIGRHRNQLSELIISSGLVADVLSFRCRPMSGSVGSAISMSGMVENVVVDVGIALPSEQKQCF